MTVICTTLHSSFVKCCIIGWLVTMHSFLLLVPSCSYPCVEITPYSTVKSYVAKLTTGASVGPENTLSSRPHPGWLMASIQS